MPATNSVTKASTPALSIRALVVLAIVALAVYVIDQGSKYLIIQNLTEGQQVPFVGELLQLHFVKNSGAAFSLGTGMTWIFSIAASAVAVFIVIFARRIRSAGWAILFGLLFGGTIGNLTDRLFREPSFGQGHVIDFLQVAGFPAIFNIADSAIVASMGLFIILTLRGVGLDGRRTVAAKKVSTAEASVGEPLTGDTRVVTADEASTSPVSDTTDGTGSTAAGSNEPR
ncbi:signal peptidase II [Glaciihabitans sp. dw_435]|uniref:signal peptidase II n=1 Tax=Glaciihabitans sp. dw_435 TaxID=2720081 RepID=UPI001C4A115A|nr:signal peptidase II [Glaciihabitans sp. dw_435]